MTDEELRLEQLRLAVNKACGFPNYYPLDENVMREAEETLTDTQRPKYVTALVTVARRLPKGSIRHITDSDFVVIHASRSQRAEAFLMVKKIK